MRILIIEDELPAAERLIRLCKELQPAASIEGPVESVSEATAVLHQQSFDLVLCDIELADGTAFEIFRQVSRRIPVIFTTAYHHYALDAFQTFAVDYLLKPVSREKLQAAIERYEQKITPEPTQNLNYERLAQALERQQPKPGKRYLAHYRDKMVVVEEADVAYFYSEHRTTYAVLFSGRKYSLEPSLQVVAGEIDRLKFFQINRNVVIAFKAVSEISGFGKSRLRVHSSPALPEGNWAEVSASRTPSFRKWLGAKE